MSRAVIAYSQWEHSSGVLLPGRCGPSVARRWGIPLRVASTLMQISVLVPEPVWNHAKSQANIIGNLRRSYLRISVLIFFKYALLISFVLY